MSMSIPKVGSLSVLLVSLEEMVREVLEAPQCSHHHQPVSMSRMKVHFQTAQLVTLETASNLHKAPAC